MYKSERFNCRNLNLLCQKHNGCTICAISKRGEYEELFTYNGLEKMVRTLAECPSKREIQLRKRYCFHSVCRLLNHFSKKELIEIVNTGTPIYASLIHSLHRKDKRGRKRCNVSNLISIADYIKEDNRLSSSEKVRLIDQILSLSREHRLPKEEILASSLQSLYNNGCEKEVRRLLEDKYHTSPENLFNAILDNLTTKIPIGM